MKDTDEFFSVIIGIIIIVGVLIIVAIANAAYNAKEHSDDVAVTEWISPDGVHYWYQQSGYHAMLAPRYDAEGKLVIDEVE